MAEDKPTLLWNRVCRALAERNALADGNPEETATHARQLLGTTLVDRFVSDYYLARVSGKGRPRISDFGAELLVRELETLAPAGSDDEQNGARRTLGAASDPLVRVPTDLEEAEAFGQDDSLRPSSSSSRRRFFPDQPKTETAPEPPGDSRRQKVRNPRRFRALAVVLLIVIAAAVSGLITYRQKYILTSSYKEKAEFALEGMQTLRDELGKTRPDAPEAGVTREGLDFLMDRLELSSSSTEPDKELHYHLARMAGCLQGYMRGSTSLDATKDEEELGSAGSLVLEGGMLGLMSKDLKRFDACKRATAYFMENGRENPDDEAACDKI